MVFSGLNRFTDSDRGGGLAVAPPQSAGTRSPAIDRQALLSRSLNNRAFAVALLSELRSSAQQQVARIGDHLADGQTQAAAELAHSLKGAASIVGALTLSRLATEVEAAARAGTISNVHPLYERLADKLAHCLDEIDRLTGELRNG
jgi:HPt (histidine-containing phosphotransfer) domain-containing protein